MKKVRWGILGTAKIAVEQVIPAMQKSEVCEVTAIASRNLHAAESAAKELNIRRPYGSYTELLSDPDIDAIYNPLPNHLHVPWSIRALEAGKHVLCEKPIALTSSQALELVQVANKHPGLKVMEAFMYRLHPQWERARDLVVSEKISKLVTIQVFFSYFNDDPENVRNIADYGGGGLMDIGCYPISLSRFIFASEPHRVAATLEYDPRFKTDRLASGILDFGRGTATFTCSTQCANYQRVHIFGTKGYIEILIPFNAHSDKPNKIFYHHNSELEEIDVGIYNQYTIQMERFSLAVLEDTEVPIPVDDAVANMKVIDAIVHSAKTGRWTDIPAS